MHLHLFLQKSKTKTFLILTLNNDLNKGYTKTIDYPHSPLLTPTNPHSPIHPFFCTPLERCV